MTERTVTDLETTALQAEEFLRRFDEAARADLSTGRGKLGRSWDHMEALIAAVRELAQLVELKDEALERAKARAEAAEADRDRLQAELDNARHLIDVEWPHQIRSAEAEAQTLRDALEALRREAENELRRQGCLCLYSRCPIHGESEGRLAAAVRAALAATDTPAPTDQGDVT